MFYEAMWGMHALWWVFWIVVIVALVSWGRGGGGGRERAPRETPHEILRRRFSHGEIDAQEYENRKAVLDKDR